MSSRCESGELQVFIQVIEVQTGEPLMAGDLDSALDRAKAEIAETPPEPKGQVRSLLDEWAA